MSKLDWLKGAVLGGLAVAALSTYSMRTPAGATATTEPSRVAPPPTASSRTEGNGALLVAAQLAGVASRLERLEQHASALEAAADTRAAERTLREDEAQTAPAAPEDVAAGHDLVQAATQSGSWDEASRLRFHEVLSKLPPSEAHTLLVNVTQALNSGAVRIATSGPAI